MQFLSLFTHSYAFSTPFDFFLQWKTKEEISIMHLVALLHKIHDGEESFQAYK